MLLLFLVQIWCFRCCQAEYECFTSGSCKFLNISYAGNSSSDRLRCIGYRSCEQSFKLEITTAFEIQCYGTFSCFRSNLVQTTNRTKDSYISCGGLYSCSNVGLIRNVNGIIFCAAEQSCVSSNIEVESAVADNDATIYCRGHRSCADSNITNNASLIYMTGHLSAMNAVFQSVGDNRISTYYFYGPHSGYNATIYCQNQIEHTVSVFCYGSGCNYLEIMSDDNCTLDINCDYAERSESSNVCPNGMISHCFLVFVVCNYNLIIFGFYSK